MPPPATVAAVDRETAASATPTSTEPRSWAPEAPAASADSAAPEAAGPLLAGPANPGPAPVPEPFTDADALDELEHQICGLEARIQVATHRLLVLLADFDRRRGWELGGRRSCADWYHAATGATKVTARERVRVARALVGLHKTSEAMVRARCTTRRSVLHTAPHGGSGV